MIHFAYPIAHLGEFCGCGRYVAQPRNWENSQYAVAHPDHTDSDHVLEAVSYLAPESSDSDYLIYEKRDQASIMGSATL